MNNGESEVFFERIEVPIAMEQRVAFLQTERRDQAINSFAYRTPAPPKRPVVLGRCNCQFCAAGVEHMKLQELVLDVGKGCISSNALQYFAKDQIS